MADITMTDETKGQLATDTLLWLNGRSVEELEWIATLAKFASERGYAKLVKYVTGSTTGDSGGWNLYGSVAWLKANPWCDQCSSHQGGKAHA